MRVLADQVVPEQVIGRHTLLEVVVKLEDRIGVDMVLFEGHLVGEQDGMLQYLLIPLLNHLLDASKQLFFLVVPEDDNLDLVLVLLVQFHFELASLEPELHVEVRAELDPDGLAEVELLAIDFHVPDGVLLVVHEVALLKGKVLVDGDAVEVILLEGLLILVRLPPPVAAIFLVEPRNVEVVEEEVGVEVILLIDGEIG